MFCFAQGPSGGSFFLLCWLKAFWWLFFWRKQPRMFCFAQGPSGDSFFLRKQPRMFCRGYRRACGVWKCGARQSHGKAQKKRSPRVHRKAKRQKKTTRKPSPNSQSKKKDRQRVHRKAKRKKKTPESHRLTRKALCRLFFAPNILSIN